MKFRLALLATFIATPAFAKDITVTLTDQEIGLINNELGFAYKIISSIDTAQGMRIGSAIQPIIDKLQAAVTAAPVPASSTPTVGPGNSK